MTPENIPCLSHRGVYGMVHYCDVTERYDASAIYQYGDDRYFLQCEAGGTLAEAQKNWEETVTSFFSRRHEGIGEYTP